jgi:tetratricopeptide (TPR) repeat protein
MIERLLAAERALADGELDRAEQLFEQVAEADERNAIAVVGLAEVAMARGDATTAHDLAERALTIDPDDAAATRLLAAAGHGPAGHGPAGHGPAGQGPGVASTLADATPAQSGRPSLVARLRAALARLLGRGG